MILALLLAAKMVVVPQAPAASVAPGRDVPAPGTREATARRTQAGRVVKVSTSMGDIRIALDEKSAPATVANFLQYVREKHYDGTIFHRVIRKFMIQGGGMDASLRAVGSKHPPVRNESHNGLRNETGTIAMARTADPDSATDQFYINVNGNAFLDARGDAPGYTVFGKVISGLVVAKKIEAVETTSKPTDEGAAMSDVPVKPVTINSIRLEK